MTKNYYDLQLDAMRQILLAAGFEKLGPDAFRPPVMWRENLVASEQEVEYILERTWHLKDAVTLYVEYLLKMSSAVRSGNDNQNF